MVAHLAHRARSARQARDDIRGAARRHVRIGDREGQGRHAHHRQVRQVIADTGAGGRRELQPCAQSLERRELVGHALQHVTNAELAATRGHLTNVETSRLQQWARSFRNFMSEKYPDIAKTIADTKLLSDETAKSLADAIEEFNKQF